MEMTTLTTRTARPVFAVRLDPATGDVLEGWHRLDGTAHSAAEAIDVAIAEGRTVVTEGGAVELAPGEVVGADHDVWTVTVEG